MMPLDQIPIKPADEYTPQERIILLREARLYMLEVHKRMERLYQLEMKLSEAEDDDGPTNEE